MMSSLGFLVPRMLGRRANSPYGCSCTQGPAAGRRDLCSYPKHQPPGHQPCQVAAEKAQKPQHVLVGLVFSLL